MQFHTDSMRARESLIEAHQSIQHHLSNELVVKFHDLYSAMVNVYTLELAHATPESLGARQALLKQAIALQKSLMRDGESPRV